MKTISLSDSDEEAILEFVKQHEELYDKTNDRFKDKQKKDFGNSKQLPETCLSRLWRSGLRLIIPDMARSLRQSQDKQLRRVQNDRHGWRTVSVFYEVTSEGREFPSLLHSSHPRGLLQPQPQLQFRIHPETQNLRWKLALHQILLISLRAPVPSDDSLQLRQLRHLQIQS